MPTDFKSLIKLVIDLINPILVLLVGAALLVFFKGLAAFIANIMLPVKLMLRSEVEAMWGTAKWNDFVADVPVKDLELVPVPAPTPAAGLDERINLSRDYDSQD